MPAATANPCTLANGLMHVLVHSTTQPVWLHQTVVMRVGTNIMRHVTQILFSLSNQFLACITHSNTRDSNVTYQLCLQPLPGFQHGHGTLWKSTEWQCGHVCMTEEGDMPRIAKVKWSKCFTLRSLYSQNSNCQLV